MRTDYVQTGYRLTGSDLKLIACISMLVDHLAFILPIPFTAELILIHLIGRLAFPIFAFLLVEGFTHSRHRGRYLCSLFLFALLSELPFDLVINNTSGLLPEFTYQNTLFTLTLGLLMLWSIEKAEALLFSKTSAYQIVFFARLPVIFFFGAAAQFLNLDYGFLGMACIGAMYIFRARPVNAAFWGCVGLNLMFSLPGAFLSVVPLSFYDGTRGKQRKYFFYFFYPLHLLALWLLKKYLIPG